jgi:hypothetical protein
MLIKTLSLFFLLASSDATFRTETRLLLLDVLAPSQTLTTADFSVKLNGQPRDILHTATTTIRRPLAILLYLNLAPEGALRHLHTPAARAALTASLSRLDSADEVALYGVRDWFAGEAQLLSPLTRDRAALLAALDQTLTAPAERQLRPGPLMHSLTDTLRQLALSRPDSLATMLYLSDGMNPIDAMTTRDRAHLATQLASPANLAFNEIRLNMALPYAAAASVLNPLGLALGYRLTGTGEFLAHQTGGLSLKLDNPADLPAAIDQLLQSFTHRYTLAIRLHPTDAPTYKIDLKARGVSSKHLHYRRLIQ